MKMEFHIHTPYSDGLNPIKYLKWYGRNKLLVITDHNTIRGSLEYKKYRPTIIAEEILCKRDDGRNVELIGLFINEEIPKGLHYMEVIDMIRAQGGLVVAPHPLDQARYGFGEDADKYVDIIEVFNAKIDDPIYNNRAQEIFKDSVKIVGSDAHYPLALNSTEIEIDEFDIDNPKDFLNKLKSAKFRVKYYSWPTRMLWRGWRIIRKILKNKK
ncbi:MAG: hypothetical protein QXV16_02115 [Candidatus Anstonellales archaeon]